MMENQFRSEDRSVMSTVAYMFCLYYAQTFLSQIARTCDEKQKHFELYLCAAFCSDRHIAKLLSVSKFEYMQEIG